MHFWEFEMPLSLQPSINIKEVTDIHEKSLYVLESVGIDYKTPRAIEILEEAGCAVDYDRTWASIPPDLVEWALKQAPRVVQLEARDRSRNVILDGKDSHHTNDSQGTRAIDLHTGERRVSTLQDLEDGLRFADALDKLEIVHAMVAAQDVPSHIRTIQHFASAFTQTSKHVRTGVLHAGQVPFLVDMVMAATGEDEFRPIFSAVDCTISPLMHDELMTEACIELAKLGVPIMVYPMPLAGGTSPITAAGTSLIFNAEFLSGLVLFQIINPGTPIIYGIGASILDMRTGNFAGSAALQRILLTLREMGRFYNLPVNLWGCGTSSLELDAQYGHDATTNLLFAFLARADEIYSMGLLGSSQFLSLEKMVLDNHLTKQVEIMTREIPTDEDDFQLKVIEKVGIGGNFLGERETREFTTSEYVPPWPPEGRTMLEVAREEAMEIYDNHVPPPLPNGAEGELERILREADRALSKYS
jgi:trimethylamine--corrinoid protein Co-methyltransferase